MEDKYIVALEIGSSKIKGAIGTIDDAHTLTVKAVEEEKISDIVRYGTILNVAETATAIRNVISRLEHREAPRRIEAVYLAAGGRSLRVDPIQVERRLAGETEITRDLIGDLVNEALATPLHDRQVVHATMRELRIDDTPAPRPIGRLGSHIVASMNLISCRNQLLRNLSHVVEERLHLRTVETFIRPLAIADLVLNANEMRLGCALVDFGAETTTVAVYKDDTLRHLAVLPLGSRNITRDITHLNYLEETAEDLKIRNGSALQSPELAATFSAGASHEISMVNNYVAARSAEIIANIIEQIKQSGIAPDKLPCGIIIVGGGARLNGFNQRLKQTSGMNVRVGVPGPHIRITDGTIQPSEAVDVIATLVMAAKNNPRECMTRPAPVPAPAQQHSAGIYGADSIYAQQTNQMPPAQQPMMPQQPQQPQQPLMPQQPAAAPQQPIQQPVQQPAQQPAATVQQPQQPQQPQQQQQPQMPKAPTYEVMDGNEKPSTKGAFGRMLSGLGSRILNLMTDTMYENDEDDDQ